MVKRGPLAGDSRWNEQERAGTPMAGETRICEWCNGPFEGRSDAVYCSRNHKRAASRARKLQRQRSNYLSELVTPSESSASAEASRAANDRFRAILAADKASRTPDAQEREWQRWERQHPGTAHPDRVRARMLRGKQAADEDWVQGTRRFAHAPMTLAEQARAARGRQRQPVPSAGHDSYDDDPELQAEMIDMGNWRRGRKW